LVGQGVAKKTSEGIAKFVGRTGGPSVFDSPVELADRLGYYHRELLPLVRKRILEDWFAGRNIAIPQGLLERVEESPATQTPASKDPDRWSVVGGVPIKDPQGQFSWIQALQFIEVQTKAAQSSQPQQNETIQLLIQQNRDMLQRLDDQRWSSFADTLNTVKSEVVALKGERRLEGSVGVLDRIVSEGFGEIRGLRQDVKPLGDTPSS
jgi:hypothetical protein